MLDVKPWIRPVAVLAITAPIVIAWVVAGPFLGIMVAGIVAVVLVLVAIRLSPEPPRRRSERRQAPSGEPYDR